MLKLHDIRIMIVVHAVLLFILRPFYTLYNGPNFITSVIDMEYYILSIIICIIGFLIVIFQVKNINLPVQLDRKIDLSVSIYRFYAVFFVWLLILFVSLQSRLDEGLINAILNPQNTYLHSDKSFIPNSVTALGGFFILAARHIDGSKVTKWVTALLILVPISVAGFISGSKSLAFYPIFLALWMWSRQNGGIRYYYIILIVVVYSVFQIFMDYYRHIGSEQGFRELVEIIISDQNNNIIESIVSRYYGTDIFYRIYLYHSSINNDFLYGSSIFSIVFIVIPRAFWLEKPVISFGKIVSENYLDDTFWGTGISAAPTWLGELYANFGYVSLPLYALSVWLIFKHIKVCTSEKAAVWQGQFYFPLAFATLAFFQEASIVGWIVQLCVFAVLSIFLTFVMFGHGALASKMNSVSRLTS